jgi:hypothetical protein
VQSTENIHDTADCYTRNCREDGKEFKLKYITEYESLLGV